MKVTKTTVGVTKEGFVLVWLDANVRDSEIDTAWPSFAATNPLSRELTYSWRVWRSDKNIPCFGLATPKDVLISVTTYEAVRLLERLNLYGGNANRVSYYRDGRDDDVYHVPARWIAFGDADRMAVREMQRVMEIWWRRN